MGESVKNNYSSASSEELAFLGDGVYELHVRKKITGGNLHKAKELNDQANVLSCAAFQAKAAKILFEKALTHEEQEIFTRGRNISHKNYPKAATKMEYKYATALECVFGWLCLEKNDKRIAELFAEIYEIYRGGNDEL